MARYYFRHQKLYEKPAKDFISQVGDVKVYTQIQGVGGTESNAVHVLDIDRCWQELKPGSRPDYIEMFLLLIGE